MKLGSEPKNKADQNESADYWEKKDEIQKHVESLQSIKTRLDAIDDEFPIREESVDNLITKSREVEDNTGLQKITGDFDKERAAIEKLLKNANDHKNAVDKIQQQMGDCEIPRTISKRAEDLATFERDLNSIKEQFEHLKEEDEDVDEDFINPDTEAEIKKLVLEIEKKINNFDAEKEEFDKMQ